MTAKRSTKKPAIPAIRDGVFFSSPKALPRGRHSLTPQQVAGAQRERLLTAVTELLAAHGYRGFGANEIAKRAGISLETFYAHFENKDECVFAGYERFIKVLLGQMTQVKITGLKRVALVKALTGSYLKTLQSDLVVARAYQVEIDALGASARERRRKSLSLFAEYVRKAVLLTAPNAKAPPELSETAYIGVVYALRQLASDALDVEAEPDLNKLQKDAEVWVSDLFRER